MLNKMYLVRLVYIHFSKILAMSNGYYIKNNNENGTSPSAEISFTKNDGLIRNVDAGDMLMSFISFDYNSSGKEIKKEVFPYVFCESMLFMAIKTLLLFFTISYVFSLNVFIQDNVGENLKQCIVAGTTMAFFLRFFIVSITEIRKRMRVIAFFSNLLNDSKMSDLSNLKISISESSKVFMFTA